MKPSLLREAWDHPKPVLLRRELAQGVPGSWALSVEAEVIGCWVDIVSCLAGLWLKQMHLAIAWQLSQLAYHQDQDITHWASTFNAMQPIMSPFLLFPSFLFWDGMLPTLRLSLVSSWYFPFFHLMTRTWTQRDATWATSTWCSFTTGGHTWKLHLYSGSV